MPSRLKHDWQSVLETACDVLGRENISTDQWTFGGGSALAYHYQHRHSRDIDIFLRDAQLLTFLTPRLNNYTERLSKHYNEMPNSLKISLTESGSEIDFIVAPLLTVSPYRRQVISGVSLNVETPEEIICKKVFYRADAFQLRDIFDLACAIKNDRGALIANQALLAAKTDPLRQRMALFKESQINMDSLMIHDQETACRAIPIVESFLDELLELGPDDGPGM